MTSRAEALKAAEQLLARETGPYDPVLVIDGERVREKDGTLIVPFNGEEYLKTRNPRDMLLDCWPILVDLTTGRARMGTIGERDFWRE
ncbi:YrhB domain-containing protein [Streptomyces catenulae]|uniref:YrhB domain-containing protein n=1 Tax=Streptomyces catenulae TaxID=66875 RepID=A0ABV2YTX6_9ACTN|nr:YrhB domain-containing protein [Streptomyces catenulae]